MNVFFESLRLWVPALDFSLIENIPVSYLTTNFQ
jgi:hypothetical protein